MREGEAITEGVSSLPSGSCMYSHAETALEDCFNLELSVAIVETEADEIDRMCWGLPPMFHPTIHKNPRLNNKV